MHIKTGFYASEKALEGKSNWFQCDKIDFPIFLGLLSAFPGQVRCLSKHSQSWNTSEEFKKKKGGMFGCFLILVSSSPSSWCVKSSRCLCRKTRNIADMPAAKAGTDGRRAAVIFMWGRAEKESLKHSLCTSVWLFRATTGLRLKPKGKEKKKRTYKLCLCGDEGSRYL